MSQPAGNIILFVCIPLIIMGCGRSNDTFTVSHGAIIRGDSASRELALVFTGDEFGDGMEFISMMLESERIKASFFLTGNFHRKAEFKPVARALVSQGHYLGSHSDRHLLYCDWTNRDSLLVNRREFHDDLEASYGELKKAGISRDQAHYFLPPYEWYNDTIALWTERSGLQLINFTPGTRSNADYTYPEMGSAYTDSRTIYNSVLSYEASSASGLNGFILLFHAGTDPRRTDKFYLIMPELVRELKGRGYTFVRIDELLDVTRKKEAHGSTGS